MTNVAESIPMSQAVAERNRGASRFFWGLTLLSTVFGGLFAAVGMLTASGAPQEAAAAAIGCLFAVAPYCLARAVDELRK
jgi:hypothetical protein